MRPIEVLIVGGPHDGELVSLPSLGPIRVAQPDVEIPPTLMNPEPRSVSVSTIELTPVITMAGWRAYWPGHEPGPARALDDDDEDFRTCVFCGLVLADVRACEDHEMDCT